MNSHASREYASQVDYIKWVRKPMETRSGQIVNALRKAFENIIRKEEVEVILFSELTASELADK